MFRLDDNKIKVWWKKYFSAYSVQRTVKQRSAEWGREQGVAHCRQQPRTLLATDEHGWTRMKSWWIRKKVVIPAKAGIQAACNTFKFLDSRFRGNDEIRSEFSFCESINLKPKNFTMYSEALILRNMLFASLCVALWNSFTHNSPQPPLILSGGADPVRVSVGNGDIHLRFFLSASLPLN